MESPVYHAKKILICLRYGIGDVVMEMPALETLRKLAPEAHITALGAHPALELLEDFSLVNELACIQHWGLEHWGDYGNAEIHPNIHAWLEWKQFDLILDPSHAVIAVKNIVLQTRHTILDTWYPNQEQLISEGKRGLTIVKKAVENGWGIHIPFDLMPQIRFSPEENQFADQFLGEAGWQDALLLGISPVASSHLKQWPLEKLTAAINHLLEESDYHFLLFSGPHQEEAHKIISQIRYPDRVLQVNAIHLRKVAALLARCRSFLCNDTGLMHMAAAVGIPVVAVFGPTFPGIYLPENETATALGWENDCPYRKTSVLGPSECIIYNRCLIGSHGCIHQVQISDVLKALNKSLQFVKTEAVKVSFKNEH